MAGSSDAPASGKEMDKAPAPLFPNSRLKPSGAFLPSTLKFYTENPNRTMQDTIAYYESLGLPPCIDGGFGTFPHEIRLPLFDTIAELIIELSRVPPHNLTRIEAIREEIYTILAETTSRQTGNPGLYIMATPGPITWWVEKDIERSRALLPTLGDEEAANLRKLLAKRQRDILGYDGSEPEYIKD